MLENMTMMLASLKRARTFEEAAATALAQMLRVAREALARSTFAARGKIARGMVHLRPGDGYRRLVVVEEAGDTTRVVRAGGQFLPSATAWRWVVEHRVPIAIDVNIGMIDVGATGSAQAMRAGAVAVSNDSQEKLLQRETTHVLVIPLRSPNGAIDGMVSIEADCRAAIGRPFIFPECLGALQELTDVAELFLCTLPLRLGDSAEPDELLPVIGASMADVVQMLRVFAQQEETLLLSGPTGAGKSRLARWCHEQSPRRAGVFETLDLSTVPENLQMAELVGWKKGAFTGALKDTGGYVARADGGSLFIDEIDKLSLKAQAGLLRMLEERRYRPLGDGAGDRRADVRFIVCTNTDLCARVRDGSFREDLYFRINVLPVRVPPLVDRKDEIPRWAAYVLGRRHGSGRPGAAQLSSEAEVLLSAQPWPGNLRQLDNIVRRAYALALMDQDSAAGNLTLEARHVRRALAYEEGAGQRSVVELFHITATAFVAEAVRRQTEGGVLDLDLADALRGFILGIAAQRVGNKEDAYRLLGKEALVQSRNHTRPLRREMDRVEALCKAFGEQSTAPFGRAGEGEDG